MPLTARTRLGPYDVLAPLGAGGMGEVYRARDTRLGRDVAIKALPAAFASDAERLARFRREAQTLASLNHANIAAIYGLEEHDGGPYLVLELVDGETLADRVARGALSTREALALGVQIAAAIEAAHERGIVHRDLKPGNVMITPAGAAKVLDFGLATSDASAGGNDLTMAVHAGLSRPGAIVGTAAYMSPEQARGMPVDRRSDVWSFGCVLFECFAGRAAFRGETQSDLLARILEREPEWAALPESTPPRVREILRRCLRRDADARPRDIRDVRIELSEIAAGGARSAAGREDSIAVLPFVNMSSDKEQEYFSDGLSEELLNLLAQVPELRVIARTSSFAFKGKEVDVATIAQQLNVANLLEGSVRKSGNTLRITAQLIRAADSSHLWSQTFDREMTDVFKVQDEIATAVVGALKLKLLPQAHAGKAQSSNTEAYNKYLLGRQYNLRQTTEGYRNAVSAFTEAIALDPQYAAAWAGLARAEAFAADYAGSAEAIDGGKARARAAADRAVQLGPDVPEAYTARALLRANSDWDWAGAEADLERALQLDSGNASVHSAYSGLLVTLGRNAEALDAAKRANELDPLSSTSWNTLANALWATGDLAGARAAMERALAINPESDFAQINIAALDLVEGRYQAALDRFQRMDNMLWKSFGVALVEHSLGHAEASGQALDWLVREQAAAAAYQIGDIYAWQGQTDKAFEWLERARVQRDGGLSTIKSDFLLASLHDDPRYPELLKRLGLPPD
jgi:serine/threonine protein kinase/Tfp pilus assembly protein PilF